MASRSMVKINHIALFHASGSTTITVFVVALSIQTSDNDDSMVGAPVDGAKDSPAINTNARSESSSSTKAAIQSVGATRNTAATVPLLHDNNASAVAADNSDDDWLVQVFDRNAAAATFQSRDKDTSTIGNVVSQTKAAENKPETADGCGNVVPHTKAKESESVNGAGDGAARETMVGHLMPQKDEVAVPELVADGEATPIGGNGTANGSAGKNFDMIGRRPSAVAWEEEVAMISAEPVRDSLSLDSLAWDSFPSPPALQPPVPTSSQDDVPPSALPQSSHPGTKKWACLAIGLLTIVIAAALAGGLCGRKRCQWVLSVSTTATTTPIQPAVPDGIDPTGFLAFTTTEELYNAVDDYLNVTEGSSANSTQAAFMYGYPIGTWNVSHIKDFT
jgi:hypothetical protein